MIGSKEGAQHKHSQFQSFTENWDYSWKKRDGYDDGKDKVSAPGAVRSLGLTSLRKLLKTNKTDTSREINF